MAIVSATDETPNERSPPPTLLGPGFRFHPTDEELVSYYLRRKVCGKGFRVDAISEIDIYKIEPWDLPSFSKLKTRDLEWYFFSALDKKYGNGARTNRATDKGYWKTTGKDRAVHHRTQIVGMKKTLVYHIGRAPKGQRTNWVMHEYRLIDLELEKAGVAKDAFVLCRVFEKTGTGPKNGEKYGAPFVEEEWEDDEELEFIPQVEGTDEVVNFGEDYYLDGDGIEQILGAELPVDTTAIPLSLQSFDGNNSEVVTEPIEITQQLLLEAEQYHATTQLDGENLNYTEIAFDMDANPDNFECVVAESSKSGEFDYVDFLLDEPTRYSSDNLQFPDGDFFLNANDGFLDTIETNTFDMVNDYTLIFDSKDSCQQNVTCDASIILGSEALISNKPFLPQKELDEETSKGNSSGVHPADDNDNDTPSPFDMLDCAPYEPDFEYPFIKQASKMLGNISAPQAFASEYPSKETIRRLNSLSSPASSVHVTAGMIRIQNVNPPIEERGREQPSLGKSWNVNVVLSFGISRSNGGGFGFANVESSFSILPGKYITLLSRKWFRFLILWVLFISFSLKLGGCILAK